MNQVNHRTLSAVLFQGLLSLRRIGGDDAEWDVVIQVLRVEKLRIIKSFAKSN